MDSGFETSHALRVKKWDDKALYEYQDQLILRPFMSTKSEDGVIYVHDVFGKEEGDVVVIPLIAALTGEGVVDDATLEGEEEAMTAFDFEVRLRQYRHAMRTKGKLTARRTAFKLKDQFRPLLTRWLAQKTETHLFDAMASIGGVRYQDATTGEKNTWHDANSDRILYGATTTNFTASDHAASLQNVDSSADKLTTSILTLVKRRAKRANPKVRPLRVKENAESGAKEWWVAFCDTICLRDLEADTAWQSALRDARERGEDNPMFTGAYGTWRGIIIIESEKNLRLDNVGASSIDVAANFLCGAQALVFAPAGDEDRMNAQVTMTEETFDYKNKVGVSIAAMYGHGKAVFNSKDHGIVTFYCSAVDD